MGVLDFLFEGSPPPSTTTYGSSVSNMPQWLSDYTQGIIARANTQAAEPYQQYGGPRVAGFTDDQNNAFDVIRNNIGGWNDEFDASKQATQGGLSQAMPLFQQAAQSTPSQVQNYMDPYVGSVIDRGTQLANRNYEENIAPGISARFIRGGQSGSAAHQRETENAARDLTEGVQSNAMAALSDAYKTAGSQYQTDASRLGQLGTSVGSLGLQAGQQFGNLATQQQALTQGDARALDASGQEQQQQTQKNLDTAYGDFTAQRDDPKNNIDWLNSIIHGVPSQNSTSTTTTGPGNSFQPSPISQLIAAYGMYKDIKRDGGVVESRYAKGGKVGRFTGALDLLKETMGDLHDYLPDDVKPKTDDDAMQFLVDYDRAGRSKADFAKELAARRAPIKKAMGGLARYADGGSVKALHSAADQMDGIIAKALGIAVGGRGGLSSLEFNYGT